MRGIIFTEFANLVESAFGEDMMDTLIETTLPASKGAYTSVGNYDFAELAAMVEELSKQTNTQSSALLQLFGQHLANVFSSAHVGYFIEASNTINLLKQVDQHIHVQVKKLYPDAVTPRISYQEATDDKAFTLCYQSKRPLMDVAHGLIEGVAHYYNEQLSIERKDWQKDELYCASFEIRVLQS